MKYNIGDCIIVGKEAGIINDYDEEDNSYRVGFNDNTFSWISEDDIKC